MSAVIASFLLYRRRMRKEELTWMENYLPYAGNLLSTSDLISDIIFYYDIKDDLLVDQVTKQACFVVGMIGAWIELSKCIVLIFNYWFERENGDDNELNENEVNEAIQAGGYFYIHMQQIRHKFIKGFQNYIAGYVDLGNAFWEDVPQIIILIIVVEERGEEWSNTKKAKLTVALAGLIWTLVMSFRALYNFENLLDNYEHAQRRPRTRRWIKSEICRSLIFSMIVPLIAIVFVLLFILYIIGMGIAYVCVCFWNDCLTRDEAEEIDWWEGGQVRERVGLIEMNNQEREQQIEQQSAQSSDDQVEQPLEQSGVDRNTYQPFDAIATEESEGHLKNE